MPNQSSKTVECKFIKPYHKSIEKPEKQAISALDDQMRGVND